MTSCAFLTYPFLTADLVFIPFLRQILADFDYTISYLRYGPERMSSSFGAVEKYSQMSQEFRDRTKLLHDHYYALEVDGSIPKEEKANLMTEW